MLENNWLAADWHNTGIALRVYTQNDTQIGVGYCNIEVQKNASWEIVILETVWEVALPIFKVLSRQKTATILTRAAISII